MPITPKCSPFGKYYLATLGGSSELSMRYVDSFSDVKESDSKFKYNSCSERLEPNSGKLGTLIRVEVTSLVQLYGVCSLSYPRREQMCTGGNKPQKFAREKGPVQLTYDAKTLQYEPPEIFLINSSWELLNRVGRSSGQIGNFPLVTWCRSASTTQNEANQGTNWVAFLKRWTFRLIIVYHCGQ